jgi:transcriptional regulator with XRE-family HTH domain
MPKILELLEKKLEGRKASEVAAEMDVSVQFLSMVRHGKRPPSETILKWLGLDKVITYRKRK